MSPFRRPTYLKISIDITPEHKSNNFSQSIFMILPDHNSSQLKDQCWATQSLCPIFSLQKFKQRCLQPNSPGFSRNRYPDASQSLPVLVWLLVFCPETGDCSLKTFSRQEYGQLSLGECYGLLHSQGFSMSSGKSIQRNNTVFKACRQILYKSKSLVTNIIQIIPFLLFKIVMLTVVLL